MSAARARRALWDPDRIAAALAAGEPIAHLLLDRDARDPVLHALGERASAAGVPVQRTSARELWRLAPADVHTPVLAVLGPPADVGLDALMARDGPVWLLAGVAYAGNTGFAVRTAEVSGAAGVAIHARFEQGTRASTLRIAMGAHRFFPVVWEEADAAVDAARRAGRRIVGIEDSGTTSPWDADLRPASLFAVGGEHAGVARPLLDRCDLVLRVPMQGFIPAYNLQAVVAAVAIERLRQVG